MLMLIKKLNLYGRENSSIMWHVLYIVVMVTGLIPVFSTWVHQKPQ